MQSLLWKIKKANKRRVASTKMGNGVAGIRERSPAVCGVLKKRKLLQPWADIMISSERVPLAVRMWKIWGSCTSTRGICNLLSLPHGMILGKLFWFFKKYFFSLLLSFSSILRNDLYSLRIYYWRMQCSHYRFPQCLASTPQPPSVCCSIYLPLSRSLTHTYTHWLINQVSENFTLFTIQDSNLLWHLIYHLDIIELCAFVYFDFSSTQILTVFASKYTSTIFSPP